MLGASRAMFRFLACFQVLLSTLVFAADDSAELPDAAPDEEGAEVQLTDSRRKVTIPWRAVEGATRYEFQLAANSDMDPLVLQKKTQATELVVQIKPGTYYYRVRTMDAKGAPGPWTNVEAFAVNPAAPDLVAPANKERFQDAGSGAAIVFQWKKAPVDADYVFELIDKKGTLLNRRIQATSYEWNPSEPGVYQWRVGYQSPQGVEWSKKRAFLIGARALPTRTSSGQVVLIERSDVVENWFFFKGIQAVASYSFEDPELAESSGSGSALVGGAGFDYRFASARKAGRRFRLLGQTRLEIFRQILLENTYWLPRFQFQSMFSRVDGSWRHGPTVSVSAKRVSIFAVRDNSRVVRNSSATRFGLGVGYGFRYEISDRVMIRGNGGLRSDMGGKLPGPGKAKLGVEADFGFTFVFDSRKLALDLDTRVANESLAFETSKGDVTISTTYYMIEAGLGFPF